MAVGMREAALSGTLGGDQAALSALLKLRQVLPRRIADRLGEMDDTFVHTPRPDEPQIPPGMLLELAAACRRGERARLSYRDWEESHGPGRRPVPPRPHRTPVVLRRPGRCTSPVADLPGRQGRPSTANRAAGGTHRPTRPGAARVPLRRDRPLPAPCDDPPPDAPQRSIEADPVVRRCPPSRRPRRHGRRHRRSRRRRARRIPPQPGDTPARPVAGRGTASPAPPYSGTLRAQRERSARTGWRRCTRVSAEPGDRNNALLNGLLNGLRNACATRTERPRNALPIGAAPPPGLQGTGIPLGRLLEGQQRSARAPTPKAVTGTEGPEPITPQRDVR